MTTRKKTVGVFLLSILSFCFPFSLRGQDDNVVYPAQRPALWKDVLQGRRVAYAGIAASVTPEGHTLDLLLGAGVDVVKIFAPEHGFSGRADAGAKISDTLDEKTGIPIISLYGKVKKPTREMLADVDAVVFDVPDIGCRFNTKLITMQGIMEAAAAAGVEVVVLDRPNPNGHYVDGNILDTAYRSGVGKQPVPIVHGMTAGEYARMLNGEGWLEGGVHCRLRVIPCGNYSHRDRYYLPVFPTPNLRSHRAISLYPSLCFFEGTPLSEGRGTDRPFEVFGSPLLPETGFSFVPEPREGAKSSKHYGVLCHGMDLSQQQDPCRVNLEWLIWAYRQYPEEEKENFFTPFFDLLAGGPTLRRQIQAGMSAEQIRRSWQPGLERFRAIRSKYLLYEDCEVIDDSGKCNETITE